LEKMSGMEAEGYILIWKIVPWGKKGRTVLVRGGDGTGFCNLACGRGTNNKNQRKPPKKRGGGGETI